MISLISSLSFKLYVNLLVYDQNIGSLRKSLEILETFRKMFGYVRLARTLLENLRKSSESRRKSVGNCQKHCHQ